LRFGKLARHTFGMAASDDTGRNIPSDWAQPGVRRTSDCTRMADMLAAAAQADGWNGTVRTDDGWRHPLPDGGGFRHEYDPDVADGGWEFRVLRPGLSVAIVNYTVRHATPRRHCPGENLVLSTVVSGASHMHDDSGFEGNLAHGYCTLYGLEANDEFQTFYEAGEPLKWISVFIERRSFFEITGLRPEDLTTGLRRFILEGKPLAPRNIPLSSSASMAASEIFDNAYEGGFGRAFLTAKALELACQILYIQAHSLDESLSGPSFTRADFDRLQRAKSLVEANLDEPLNIHDLGRAVGLTRQKLQLGFRLLYGDTVARVRDKSRMQRALQLVRNSDLSMIEIALETGYEHPASFTRAFKAAFGRSPVSMRQLARQGKMLSLAGARAGG